MFISFPMTKRRSSTEPSSHPIKRANLPKRIIQDAMEVIYNATCRLNSKDIGDDEIIQDSEELLDNLQDLCAATCAARAAAFGRRGERNKAIDEALKAIKIRPSSPQGYLVASDLYMAHGQYKPAVEVLENGIRTVLPSGWPVLYTKREEARQPLEKKVDFISKLPSEVSSRIFTCMGYSSPEECFNNAVEFVTVSKIWRATVLQCSKTWQYAYSQGAERDGR
ncbi:hypothetical protein BJV82DRAFT_588890 [Fennellomyces sp. T-0311]|nr:hypothetical protein BJV82DRAFT_588890 [Fennellomyces sp. T-0311]